MRDSLRIHELANDIIMDVIEVFGVYEAVSEDPTWFEFYFAKAMSAVQGELTNINRWGFDVAV